MKTKTFINKVALVTGGSRGIGAAIVKRLASDGAKVAFTYVNAEQKADELVKEIEQVGGRALAIRADSHDVEAVKRAVVETTEVFGNIHILVNNAALFLLKSYDQFTIEEFDHMVAVNVRAVFTAVQAVAPQMGKGGRIITIGSASADKSGFPGHSLYSMSKAAISGLTRGLAIDLAPSGITVNNVQPGPTDTELNPAEGPSAEALSKLIALGRYGTVSEVASMVAFLASPEADYVTGATMNVNGGFMI
ncbi:3-oxoacyl-ACP reductase family protein [Bacillus cereus group sp. BfR-BA-01310]|uniref:3-oxoacyl-ACP reductase family protein n=1 Tax=Bacillus cereus group sp. BfR-BA-01310 TaxID=2920287 RepID=UPI001F58F7BA|nr:3-oxoacyl-ACP reductase family protein [Bacillus cereus group sp. BfR-BA-01310]